MSRSKAPRDVALEVQPEYRGEVLRFLKASQSPSARRGDVTDILLQSLALRLALLKRPN